MADLWVFGYGSLMWRPGFDHDGVFKARLSGFHRSLCVLSHVHRGTPAKPGLVLGLDRGGSCVGLAFKVPATTRETAIEYLRGRELVTHVYKETIRPVRLENGDVVKALTYVVDRNHLQYSGKMDVSQAASIIVGASGQSGQNIEYVANTVAHLKTLGIRDRGLEELVAAVSG